MPEIGLILFFVWSHWTVSPSLCTSLINPSLSILARPADAIDLPVCCRHVLGRGGLAGPEGVPPDVPKSAAC